MRSPDDVLHGNYVLVVVLTGCLGLLLLLLRRFPFIRKQGDSILLLGPAGAGKTTTWLQLRDGTAHNGTVASMQDNVSRGMLALEKGRRGRSVRLVDVPGHPKIRGNFANHAGQAAGIVFVIDSVDLMARKTEVAEQLLEVLSHLAIARRHVPVLLACNKQDCGAKAHTVDFVRKRLEKEIEQLRGTQGALSSSAAAPAPDDILQGAQEPFSFAALAQRRRIRVTCTGCSAQDGQLQPVHSFVRQCIPL